MQRVQGEYTDTVIDKGEVREINTFARNEATRLNVLEQRTGGAGGERKNN